MRDGLPDRGELQVGGGRDRAGGRGQVHRLQAVQLGLSVRRTRVQRGRGGDEEVHPVRGPDLQRESGRVRAAAGLRAGLPDRSEEHTSELQSLMRISYAVFCLKKKKKKK